MAIIAAIFIALCEYLQELQIIWPSKVAFQECRTSNAARSTAQTQDEAANGSQKSRIELAARLCKTTVVGKNFGVERTCRRWQAPQQRLTSVKCSQRLFLATFERRFTRILAFTTAAIRGEQAGRLGEN